MPPSKKGVGFLPGTREWSSSKSRDTPPGSRMMSCKQGGEYKFSCLDSVQIYNLKVSTALFLFFPDGFAGWVG